MTIVPNQPDPPSDTPEALLRDPQSNPTLIRDHTNVLGGMFSDEDIRRLDHAYTELVQRRYLEPAGVTISFFGTPKRLDRITPADHARRLGGAA